MAKKRTKAQRRAAALAAWERRRADGLVPAKGNAKPTKTSYKTALLNTREATHGDYGVNAGVAQAIKAVFHAAPEFASKLDATQRESAEMIATKFGRIISGNNNEVEHWEDIAGYAMLIAERLRAAATAASVTQRGNNGLRDLPG